MKNTKIMFGEEKSEQVEGVQTKNDVKELNGSLSFINLKNVTLNELKEVGLNSSMHGLPNIFRAQSLILKLIWTVLLLSAVGVCSFLIINSVESFLNFDVVTNVFSVSEVPVNFPTVTICNKSPYTSPIGTAFVERIMEKSDLRLNEYGDGINPSRQFSNARYAVGSNIMVSNMTKQEKQALGLSLSDMLITCVYQATPCTSDDFSWTWNIMYGNCYSFNSGYLANGTPVADKTMSRSGWFDGLELEIFAGQPTDIYSLSVEAGVHIFIHNKSAFTSLYEGYSAAVGKLTRIGVDRVFYSHMPIPYTDCSSEDDIKSSQSKLVKQILKTPYEYRYIDCVALCIDAYIVKKCGCEDISGVTSLGKGYCINGTEFDCGLVAYSNFFSTKQISSCSSLCPIECNRIEFDLTFSMADYPTRAYYEYLKTLPSIQSRFGLNSSAITYEMLRENILSVVINYEKLGYNSFEDDVKTSLLDLIGAVGGTLGLFVGMSFLSFFEVMDAFFGIVYFIALAFIKKERPQIQQSA